MDWDTARKYSIIFLILLNVALFSIRLLNESKYNLTPEKRASITALLQDKNIQLQAAIPKSFRPMKAYYIKINSPDINLYRDAFFANLDDVRRSVEFDKLILKDNSSVLEIKNGKALFSRGISSESIQNLDNSMAINYCNTIVENIESAFSNLQLANCIQRDELFIVTYFDRIKGIPFFSSYAKFIVTANGLLSAEMQSVSISSSSNIEKGICSPDEALLTLLHSVTKGEYKFSKILQIELGYDIVDKSTELQDNIKAVPFYYIVTDEGEIEINAYTNTN